MLLVTLTSTFMHTPKYLQVYTQNTKCIKMYSGEGNSCAMLFLKFFGQEACNYMNWYKGRWERICTPVK